MYERIADLHVPLQADGDASLRWGKKGREGGREVSSTPPLSVSSRVFPAAKMSANYDEDSTDLLRSCEQSSGLGNTLVEALAGEERKQTGKGKVSSSSTGKAGFANLERLSVLRGILELARG